LTKRKKQVTRTKSQTRAKVVHQFFTFKRLWGFAKNANRKFAIRALINIEHEEKPLGGISVLKAPREPPKWFKRAQIRENL
jgi:hypothetical protein